MLNRTTDSSQKYRIQKAIHQHQNITQQHGKPKNDSNLLLDVPVEILARITSNLDPPSLFALSAVRRYLYEHVADENTWRSAFLSRFLGISLEGHQSNRRETLMLRRSESSWKKEFTLRYNLIRKWEKSRNTTTTHTPLYSQISDMHYLQADALLSVSIQYGIVARSSPLTGRVLPGYLDATGSTIGRGVGNPNAEFTPNVSACAFTSDGGTVRLLWGYETGEVAFMTTNKTMETARRTSAEFRRCTIREEHRSGVTDAVWLEAQSGWLAVTAGQDGHVKLWDSNAPSCLWTSEPTDLQPEPYVKVAASYLAGCIAAVLRSGEIHVWSEFNFQDGTPFAVPAKITWPCPFAFQPLDDSLTFPKVLALHVETKLGTPTVLVAFSGDPCFYRIDVNPGTVTAFGDSSFGPICSIAPFFSSEEEQTSFILSGDSLGCISVYDWDHTLHEAPIAPIRTFEAHRDGSAVSAIAWNGSTLITGSILGITHVFDGLTFNRLKTFHSPVPRSRRQRFGPANDEQEVVHHILIGPNKDIVFIGVGDYVLAWRAGPVPAASNGGVRGRKAGGLLPKKVQSGPAKWSRQFELKQTISESRAMIAEEHKRTVRLYGRQNEQRSQLGDLGLTEAEAVEYVLMLSREEAQASAGSSTLPIPAALTDEEINAALEEGVFEGDFDDPPLSQSRPADLSSPPMSHTLSASSSSSSSSLSARSGLTLTSAGRSVPRMVPSHSNEKVQVSPPYIPEPMEAGDGQDLSSSSPSPSSFSLDDDSHFPSVRSSKNPSPAASSSQASSLQRGKEKLSLTITGSPSLVPVRTSPPARKEVSPKTVKSAWTIPLQKLPVHGHNAPITRSPRLSPRSVSFHGPQSHSSGTADEDLRFALELSLAEARSRGEDI